MKCSCEQCGEDKKYSWSQQYRHECEVKEIMRRFGTKEQIKAYLEKIKEKRGFDSYKKLRDDVAKEWKKSRNN
jgi:hypothetical protein